MSIFDPKIIPIDLFITIIVLSNVNINRQHVRLGHIFLCWISFENNFISKMEIKKKINSLNLIKLNGNEKWEIMIEL